MRLKFYTLKEWLPRNKKYVPLLFSFWGEILEIVDSTDFGRFTQLTEQGEKYFEFTAIPDEADFFLLPFEYSFDESFSVIYNSIKSEALHYNKQVVIFYNNDSDAPIHFENAFIFRTSFYKSTQEQNTFSLPGWSVDFKKYYKNEEIAYRKKSQIPVVGYCGYVDFVTLNFGQKKTYVLFLKQVLKNVFKKLTPSQSETYSAEKLRGKVIRKLKACKKVIPNFILRNGFWAYGIDDKIRARIEYADTVINSDYALVMRGGGNFSYRLYEVLSCGRIPIFINTDCVLPYDEFIDWEDLCIWIEDFEINKIEQKILQYNNNTSGDEFIKKQKQIRNVYEEWISPLGFHKNLYRYLKSG